MARKRLAGIAERGASAGQLGFGVRAPGPAGRRSGPVEPSPPTGRGAPAYPVRRVVRHHAGRLLSAAADRPLSRSACRGRLPARRTAWIEIDLEALTGSMAAAREMSGGLPAMPVVKADAYGHGWCPSLACSRARERCSAWPPSTRPLCCGAGVAVEILVLYRSRPRGGVATRLDVTLAGGAPGRPPRSHRGRGGG
jgi:hypothetical protein